MSESSSGSKREKFENILRGAFFESQLNPDVYLKVGHRVTDIRQKDPVNGTILEIDENNDAKVDFGDDGIKTINLSYLLNLNLAHLIAKNLGDNFELGQN